MDLYKRMGDDLRALFEDLFDPAHAVVVRKKIAKILMTANQIGGPLQREARQLNQDILSYLEKPKDANRVAIVKKHALRLEQETRDL